MTTAETKATFLQLPRELRDIVYDYAFGSTTLALSYAEFPLVICRNPTNNSADTANGLPQWLIASRLICKEAVDLLLHTRWISPCFPTPQHHSPVPARNVFHPLESEVATCSPARQALVFHDQSIYNVALNFSKGVGFIRSPGFYHDTKPLHRSQPWTEFLQALSPFLAHSRLRLDLTVDERSLISSIPFVEWPKEWAPWIEVVDITLLATEEKSETLKWNTGVIVGRLVGCYDSRWMQPLWRTDGIYEVPTVSVEDVSASPQYRMPRFLRARAANARLEGPLLRYRLRVAAKHVHPAEQVQPHSKPCCRLFGEVWSDPSLRLSHAR